MATVRSGTFSEQGTTTAPVVTKPTGAVSGDVLYIAVLTEDSSTVTMSTRPAGFTRLSGADDANPESIDTTGAGMRLFVYKKTLGGSEGASYTFGLSASVYISWGAICVQDDGGVGTVSAFSESVSAGNGRVAAVTLATSELAIAFIGGYASGTAEGVTNWLEPTGSTRFGFYRTTTTATEEEGTTGGGFDHTRWASCTVRILAVGGAVFVGPDPLIVGQGAAIQRSYSW